MFVMAYSVRMSNFMTIGQSEQKIQIKNLQVGEKEKESTLEMVTFRAIFYHRLSGQIFYSELFW